MSVMVMMSLGMAMVTVLTMVPMMVTAEDGADGDGDGNGANPISSKLRFLAGADRDRCVVITFKMIEGVSLTLACKATR